MPLIRHISVPENILLQQHILLLVEVDSPQDKILLKCVLHSSPLLTNKHAIK